MEKLIKQILEKLDQIKEKEKTDEEKTLNILDRLEAIE